MKKKLLNTFIAILLIVTGVTLFIIISNVNRDDYQNAKNNSIKFLNNNIYELEKLSDEAITSKNYNEKEFKNVSYSYEKNSDNIEYVQFDINSKGMLGGRYWGIIYSPDDDFLDNETIQIYDENQETGKGNNIFIKERIRNNWYFYYDDYDGKIDIKNIK